MPKDEFIPLSAPNFQGNEWNYVSEALKTGWVSTSGQYVVAFEQKVAEYVGTKYAVSCQSGTAGLHLALMALGVTASHLVIVPTLTFIATVNPVKYVGAEPVFMDCDRSLCMDPEKLSRFCARECDYIQGKLFDKRTGKHIKAIVVVHTYGNMADMERIMPIAEKYNLRLVEDATEALGTRYTSGPYTGRYAGTIGDIGVFSFNGNKIITTGGGGMLVSDNARYIEKAKHLSTQAKSDELYYLHDAIGYNYRMTNLQAALGVAQMEELEEFIEIKRKNYCTYQKLLKGIDGIELLPIRKGIRGNHWFYSLNCVGQNFHRDALIEWLHKHKVQCRPVWGLIHEQKPYRKSFAYDIEKASKYWKQIVNIPCSTDLTLADLTRVVRLIQKLPAGDCGLQQISGQGD